MLLYITIAMARFPPNMRPLGVTVHTRGMLGLVGMVIVIGAVGGALGLLGWMGLSGTLIIMEVIPFLVLAVGVDNMFILSHALHRQDRYGVVVGSCCCSGRVIFPHTLLCFHTPTRTPTHAHTLTHTHHRRTSMPQRLGCALAEVGPSVTLAAACEVLAFGLGGLTGMPAIRNFSLCAAAAVALDYVLQVVWYLVLLCVVLCGIVLFYGVLCSIVLFCVVLCTILWCCQVMGGGAVGSLNMCNLHDMWVGTYVRTHPPTRTLTHPPTKHRSLHL